jgi:hypothetical protein
MNNRDPAKTIIRPEDHDAFKRATGNAEPTEALTDLMRLQDGAPVLRHWRIVDDVILLGEVSGHPHIPDGWMTTSRIVELAGDRSYARTQSRLYRLEDPVSDAATMPPGAKDAILARILRDAGTISRESLEKLTRMVDEIVGPQKPKASQ